ncbi:MAG: GNAT family N-acetyltransferase [Paludibacteraceae bacterium]|nr:GNAT family N-acetyltransferase [Paludibacteraceae bacterium]
MLSSSKLTLRALEPEDVSLLFQWENEFSLWFEGCTVVPFSHYELKQYIVNAKDIFSDKQYRFIIEDNRLKEAIGTIDLFDFDPMNQRVEVGVFLQENYRRQGYATESIRLIKEYAFKFLGVKQLYAHICEENKVSIDLFEKCGFKKVGRLEKWLKRGEEWKDCFILQCLNN